MCAWHAIWQAAQPDAQGNVLRGDVLSHAARDSYVHAQHRLVVAEAADAVPVGGKQQMQEARKLVAAGMREGAGRSPAPGLQPRSRQARKPPICRPCINTCR